MDDDIKLPPLPKPDAQYITHSDFALQKYGRACYKAGVVIGERRAKVNAKPVVHKMRLSLMPNGVACLNTSSVQEGGQELTICWTADGKAWIDSERNRVLAQKLRANDYLRAADSLDGGER